MAVVRRWARTGAGLTLGACSAAVHLLLALPVAVALLVPALRPTAEAAVRRLAALERRRIVALLAGTGGSAEPAQVRALRYLAARVPVGLLGGAVLTLLGTGLTFATTLLFSWVTQTPWLMEREPAVVVSGRLVAYYAIPGAVLLYLALAGAAGTARWERMLLARLLVPSREERLAHRVEELSRTRDAIVAAVDDERRRIERDLHDGVQQRLVALGMLLGRARRHPDRADELVAQAHDEAQRALVELREVSWRVYPAALDTGGLAAALGSVAERAPLPVGIRCDLPVEPPATVRAAAWFVISEAVTNAAKHSGALRVDVEVETVDGRLRATVRDDGHGGADPAGGGLAGLARRVAAADGTFSVVSPAGGPTVVTAELPCA
jgi:signal transduction histidine kinase